MSYEDWFLAHAAKHEKIIAKLLLKGYDKTQIIEYFVYENLSVQEPHFCPLFKDNKRCHHTKELNCFFCGCPYFRFFTQPQDNIYSFCNIKSKYGVLKCYNNEYHQDCSNCKIPHLNDYVLRNYTLNWVDKMKMCKKETI